MAHTPHAFAPARQIAFQRYHPPPAGETVASTQGTGDLAEWYLSQPALVHELTENLLMYGSETNVTWQTCADVHGDYYPSSRRSSR